MKIEGGGIFEMKIEGGGVFRQSPVRTIWTSIADLSAGGDVSLTMSSMPVERHTFLRRLVVDDTWNVQWLLADLKDR